MNSKHLKILSIVAFALSISSATFAYNPDPLSLLKGGTGANSAISARTALGAQPSNVNLDSISGLTLAADKLAYGTGLGTFALTDLTSAGRSMIGAADAAAQKTLLSLGNVENTALSTWAGSTNLTTLGTISSGTWAGTAIAANKGGTGFSSYVSGNMLVANGTSTLAKIAPNTTSTKMYLSQTSSGQPTWNVVAQGTADLSNVTGTLAIANGGTAATTASGARDNLSLGSSNTVAFANLSLSGFQTYSFQATSSTGNITAQVVFANPSSGSITTHLPDPSSVGGKFVIIKHVGSANSVIVDSLGTSKTIDGASTYTLNTVNQSNGFISDGSNWKIIF